MGDPQVNLNNAFPSAGTGDAVIDELTNDTWIYNGSLWVNSGPNPGDYLADPLVLPTSNEIVSVSSVINITYGPSSLNYNTSLLTEITPTGVNIGATISSVRVKIDLSGNTQALAVNIFTPSFGNGVGVFVPTPVLFAVVALDPADIKANIQVQARVNISLLRFAPYIYTAVNYPGLNIVINKFAPYISTPVNPDAVLFQVTGFAPDAVGAPLEIPSTQIEAIPVLPSFIGGAVPPAMIYAFAYPPGIRVGLVVPFTAITLSANIPDIGSLLVAPGITISVNKFTPTVSALPDIHVLCDHVHVLIQGGNPPGYDISNKAPWTINYNTALDSQAWNSLGPNGTLSLQNSVTKFNPTALRIDPLPVGGTRTSYQSTNTYGGFTELGYFIEFWFRADTSSFVANTPKRIFGSEYLDGNVTRQGGTATITGPPSGATFSFEFAEENTNTSTITNRIIQSQPNAILPNTWYHVFIDFWRQGVHSDFGGLSGNPRTRAAVAINGVWGNPIENTVDYSRYITQLASNQTLLFGNSNSLSNSANQFTGYIDDLRLMGYAADRERYGRNSILYSPTPYARVPTPFTPPTRSVPSLGVETETYRWLINGYKRDSPTASTRWYDGSYDQRDSVWIAVDGFVRDCKAAGIWDDIAYCLPLVGRDAVSSSTLMFPLKDPTWNPTGVNDELNVIPSNGELPSLSGTVSYSRKLGLLGNGTNFYINMKATNVSLGTSGNSHISAYITDMQTGVVVSAGYTQPGSTYLDAVPGLGGTRNGLKGTSLSRGGTDTINLTEGFFGLSRSNSSNYQYSVPGGSGTVASSEATGLGGSLPLYFLARQGPGGNIDAYGAHRAVIITYGTAIDLTLLQQCSTALAARLKSIP